MRYDEQGAARYDEVHAAAFGEAEMATATLADLASGAMGGGRARALELGVGTGRLAIPLAARGLEVHGIDNAAPMVAELRAKPGGGDVSVIAGDFADVSELVHGEYALVFVAFSTIFELQSQDDQLRCFAGVTDHLGPDGVFVVEAFAPDVHRLEQSVHVLAVESEAVVLQAVRHDPVTQRVTGHDIVLRHAGVELSGWSIRYATVPELDLMARLAGLRLRTRWGGWRGEPFTAASDRHVSVYARAT